MEMDTSRRSSFDRLREPGLKKPRLVEEPAAAVVAAAAAPPDSRSFLQRPATSVSVPVRGPYQQQEQQRQRHQEVVSQYKTALAELTFNSKPIITNLTIIAGESLHAAKAIAATICANILEVPSDQKLPSLYLLDSIVKNIGRDYIKYFAARLLEVFCEAYRQVDPSIHSGMRHLFGTWKGVFPPETLQTIEKELRFAPVVNGSSPGKATARPNSQAQRSAHSIHVNPKYLEAQQRLQQSTRAKGAAGNITGRLVESLDDADRPDRIASIISGRPWVDATAKKVQHVNRDHVNDHIHHNKVSIAYGDSGYSFDLSSRPGLGVGRVTEKFKGQEFVRSWYESASNVTRSISNQRNVFNLKDSSEISNSWKNSDEEDYMWDDISSRTTEYGIVHGSAKGHWTPDDSEQLDFEISFRKPQSTDLESRADSEVSALSLSTEEKGEAVFVHQPSSLWSQEPHLSDHMWHTVSDRVIPGISEGYLTSSSRLSCMPNSIGRTSFQSHIGPINTKSSGIGFTTMDSTGSAGHQKQVPRATSLSTQSSMLQCPSILTNDRRHQVHHLAEQDQTETVSHGDPITSHISGQLGLGLRDQFSEDFVSMMSKNFRVSNSQGLQASNMPTSSSTMPSLLLRHQRVVQQRQPELLDNKPVLPQVSGFGDLSTMTSPSEPESSGLTLKQVWPQNQHSRGSPAMLNSFSEQSDPHRAESSRQTSASSLLTAVMKSGILSSDSSTSRLSASCSQDIGIIKSQAGMQSPPPTSSPGCYASSGAAFAPTSVPSPTSHASISCSISSSQQNLEQPPLPPGPSRFSLLDSISTQSLSAMNIISTPLSSLLSSLVSKGLIMASSTDSPTSDQPGISSELKKPSSTGPSSGSASDSSVLISTATTPSDEISSVKRAPKTSDSLPQSAAAAIKNLIGFEFRPGIIRELHPEVINELLDNVPHRCSFCGLQLKLKDQLDRHLEWHVVKSSEHDSANKLSRRWYANSVCCFREIASSLSSGKTIGSLEDSQRTSEVDEQMVPADESQCVCMLCGELFEDYYSQERDQWMFKGALHLSVPTLDCKSGYTSNLASQGPIVHVTCTSETSICGLGLAKDAKLEEGA